MDSDPRPYTESLAFSTEPREPREWGYNGVQQNIKETRELELGFQKFYKKVRE
jgi:hypothetical protein